MDMHVNSLSLSSLYFVWVCMHVCTHMHVEGAKMQVHSHLLGFRHLSCDDIIDYY